MDRNNQIAGQLGICGVALRKESVDRNLGLFLHAGFKAGSLSARRAWIEIAGQPAHGLPSIVALRKESVDRNMESSISYDIPRRSLSARRAWIEICCGTAVIAFLSGRSPQGERG